MGRDENVVVFKDTERLCKTNERLKNSVRKATESQKLILQSDNVQAQEKNKYPDAAKIVVSKKRTLEAAENYNVNFAKKLH